MKRSALIIVCNGMPFIWPQINNIYKKVDEIVIIEGADNCFSKVIGSRHSTDDTVETIKDYPDLDRKVKIIQEECHNKNDMVKLGTMNCTGDVIYQVDVDEFQPHDTIEMAFEMLENTVSVKVPQRWYYKWTDTCLTTNRDHYIGAVPTRFWRNRIKEGLYPSHIPWTGYRKLSDDSWLPCPSEFLEFKHYGRHYLLLYEFQLRDKLEYYRLRDGCNDDLCKNRLDEWRSITREDVENNVEIKSYKGRRLVKEDPVDYGFEAFCKW